MLASCTMPDSLDTVKVQAELCNLPNESKSAKVFISLTIILTVVCICVAFRIATRVLTKRVRADNYVMLAALF
jgi:hypothetical protein